MTLSRDEFLQKHTAIRYRTISVQGDELRFQSLTVGETRRLMRLFMKDDGEFDPARGQMFSELLVGACMVDEEGYRLFTEDEVMNGALSNVDNAVMKPLFRELRQWTGVSVDPDYQAIEDAAKNSVQAVTQPSSSGSPTLSRGTSCRR